MIHPSNAASNTNFASYQKLERNVCDGRRCVSIMNNPGSVDLGCVAKQVLLTSSIPCLLHLRAEVAGGECFQCAETCSEFVGVDTPLAEEPAEKFLGAAVFLERITFAAAGNQVAIGIASLPRARNHVVQAPR